MSRFVIVAGLLALVGCSDLSDAQTGKVQSFDGNSVVIRGPGIAGQSSRPPAAMAVMARDLCEGARFISVEPGGLYTFSCR
ncbi:hypothetical protein Q5Y75_19205 [Ruegeria sp. 2205SS24-7]|uniref:hypothetical protein n=1 Tax=Ruegeria discodermiae TaxID=3064389 RepID=UPI00274277AE|nr:hypothetical protein [Ruegeria sp. 2205SS24-7]MDP5219351.1 hypothetical protein [Ruegeria sp. 2205SS24-7]